MQDILMRVFENLVERVGGPLTLRLILQPVVAICFAIRDGRRDARTGQPPYFWAVFSNPDHRRDLLRDGWKSVGKVFVLAMVLDVIYQIIVIRWVYPVETLMVACILAIVPYLLVRGPLNRILGNGSPDCGKDRKP
jgi:hypothetical protein